MHAAAQEVTRRQWSGRCSAGMPSCRCELSWVLCAVEGGGGCRRERRRAQGLPEELTPEEQEEERKKVEAEAARQSRGHLPVKPVTRINRMREILVQMKKTTDPVRLRAHCEARAKLAL